MKPHDTRGAIYRPHVKGKLVAVSFVTVGELLFGARKRNWGPTKVAELDRRLQAVVIVPYDRELCETYADLKVKLEAAGRRVEDNDLWIAASAIRHDVPLAGC